MSKEIDVSSVSECALLVRFKDVEPALLPLLIGEMTQLLYSRGHYFIMNITPAIDSLLIDYLPHRITDMDLHQVLCECLDSVDLRELQLTNASLVKLPVYYDMEVAPDIARYLSKGISLEQLVDLHSQITYTVTAIGFAPGFAFMDNVAKELQMPRLSTPRLLVPKGSVAIADHRTAVYPDDSPGGWNIIGNCPIELYQQLTAYDPIQNWQQSTILSNQT
ncbi:allophanate hydrolase 2 subunit 1 [Vibrio ponticus]|nr:allophanate hydrolase 2 subunit 1 [Vibrio ponticus]